jgi:CopG antitoxin of type II toxin-antitoxin system
MHKRKQIDPMPEEFASYEEAAEFWDTHDTTDYPEAFRIIEVVSELRRRHYEIEIDADVIKTLRRQARRKGIPSSQLANELLRQHLTTTKRLR